MKMLLVLFLALPAAAYEPQFAIPDETIDANFKNAAAEHKALDESAVKITSTQTLSGSVTFAAAGPGATYISSAAITYATISAGNITVSSLTATNATIRTSSLTVTSTTGMYISTFSNTANGFTYLPGGLLMQWGSQVIAGVHTTNYTINFPKAFPNAVHEVIAYLGETVATGTTSVSCPRVSAAVGSFVCQFGSLTGGTYQTTVHFMAIGY